MRIIFSDFSPRMWRTLNSSDAPDRSHKNSGPLPSMTCSLGFSFVSGINDCLLFTFQTWIVESMLLKHWKKFCKDDLAHIRAYPINIFSPVSPFWLNSLKLIALIITTVFKRKSPLCLHDLSQQASLSQFSQGLSSHRLCSHIIQCFWTGSFVFGKFPFIESQNSVVS